MRIAILAAGAALFAVPALRSQTHKIELSKWTIEQINGSGTWTIDSPKQYCEFTNSVNTDCSILVSDFVLTRTMEFRMSVKSVGDDDIVGFVLGYKPNDFTNANADYLLVDWKQKTQTYQDWGTSNAGLAISRVQGAPKVGYGGGSIDHWSHTGVVKELARANTLGNTGWQFDTKYFFKVTFNPGYVEIFVNGNREFFVTGPFAAGGNFGCYNYSQSGMQFQWATPGTFKAYGSGCGNSAGTPYLFAPSAPLVGAEFPVIVANLPPQAPALLFLGLSNKQWGTIPLPLDLSQFGASGCSLLASWDILNVVPNYNGTGYWVLPLPNDLPASAQFFLQGAALDPTANSLGMVFSNGGGATLGIR